MEMTRRSSKNASMAAVGFEPTPFRTGALNRRLRPLGHATYNHTMYSTPLPFFLHINPTQHHHFSLSLSTKVQLQTPSSLRPLYPTTSSSTPQALPITHRVVTSTKFQSFSPTQVYLYDREWKMARKRALRRGGFEPPT